MGLAVDISMTSEAWAAQPGRDADIEAAIAASVAATDVRLADEAEVSVVLCDDATIQALNRDWRGFDKPTNVLSFPAAAPEKLRDAPLLGDIIIAYETTAREAREEGKSLRDHTVHLVVHGFLHLLGHDHIDSGEAETMESLETRILLGLGIADPYADGPAS